MPFIFKSSVLTKQKMIEHVCDNDYHSDEEQVKGNKKTLLNELNSAIRAFTIEDPLK